METVLLYMISRITHILLFSLILINCKPKKKKEVSTETTSSPNASPFPGDAPTTMWPRNRQRPIERPRQREPFMKLNKVGNESISKSVELRTQSIEDQSKRKIVSDRENTKTKTNTVDQRKESIQNDLKFDDSVDKNLNSTE